MSTGHLDYVYYAQCSTEYFLVVFFFAICKILVIYTLLFVYFASIISQDIVCLWLFMLFFYHILKMIRWHHGLDGHEFEQALGVGDGQESLACCSPWGHKESDMTEKLNWTERRSIDLPLIYGSLVVNSTNISQTLFKISVCFWRFCLNTV